MRFALTSFLLLFSVAKSFALSSGPLFATSCTNDASFGTTAWTNVGNACAEDAAVASESGVSQYIQAVGLGFSLPGNAVIVGIQADVKKQATSGQLVVDNSVKLYVNGVVSGTEHKQNLVDWVDTALTYYTYGGSSDTWGLTLTGADINNANFGLAFACNKDAGGVNTGNVDAIRFTIFYTVAPTQTQIINGTIRNGTLR